jgi:multimeric flavodoxin WrbA
MNIVAFVASPRKGSNTDTLVDETLRAAETNGHTHEKIYLYDYEISPCIDCRKCKKDDLVCPIKDGMQEIYPKIDRADVIIYGTPNYWFGPSATMKLLMDRLRPYVANGKLKGKKAAVITPAADGPDACEPLIEMFRMGFDYLGVEFAGPVLVKAYERGEIKSDEKQLQKAYDLGLSL